MFEDAIPLYAAGALDRDERHALEAHLLTGCVVCHAALKEARSLAGLLPHGLSPLAPPPRLRQQLMAELTRESGLQPGGKRVGQPAGLEPGGWMKHVVPPPPTWRTSPAVAAVLMLLLAGTAAYALAVRSQFSSEASQRRQVELALQAEGTRIAVLQRQIDEQGELLSGIRQEFNQRSGSFGEMQDILTRHEAEAEQLRLELAAQERESAGLRKALAQRDDMLALLRSPDARVVSLTGSAAAKSAGAFLLFDPETKRAFLYAFNMPALPPGKTYQLWSILEKPVSAGTFGMEPGHKCRHMVRNIPDPTRITKFAVSLEPEGGRPEPTGEIYLVGQL